MVTHLICLCSLLIGVIEAYKREWNYPRTIWATNEFPDENPSEMIFNLNDEFLIDGIEASEKYYYLYNTSTAVPNKTFVDEKPVNWTFMKQTKEVFTSFGAKKTTTLEPSEIILKVKVVTPISGLKEATLNIPNPIRSKGSDNLITVGTRSIGTHQHQP
jgi:hypothetical protein